MKQWHYANDARNRVGPLSADALREHYRQGRLRPDSLVWCEGMAQWVPLGNVALELGIDPDAPIAGLPPPLPPRAPAPGTAALRKGMSGCLIAAIVCIVVAVPVVAILAAIAIPAYNDYLQRAQVMEAIGAVVPLQDAITQHIRREAACPGNDSDSLAPLLSQLGQHPRISALRVGTLEDGRCAFEITLRAADARYDGRALLFAGTADGASWACDGGDLPDKFRPRQCRAQPNDVPN